MPTDIVCNMASSSGWKTKQETNIRTQLLQSKTKVPWLEKVQTEEHLPMTNPFQDWLTSWISYFYLKTWPVQYLGLKWQQEDIYL